MTLSKQEFQFCYTYKLASMLNYQVRKQLRIVNNCIGPCNKKYYTTNPSSQFSDTVCEPPYILAIVNTTQDLHCINEYIASLSVNIVSYEMWVAGRSEPIDAILPRHVSSEGKYI